MSLPVPEFKYGDCANENQPLADFTGLKFYPELKMFPSPSRIVTSSADFLTPLPMWGVILLMTSFTPTLWPTASAVPLTSGTAVLEDPRVTLTVPAHGVYRNWSAEGQTLLPCVSSAVDLPDCQNVTTDGVESTSLNSMAACPWEILTDTDPLRIPRAIHYARCICRKPKMTYTLSIEEPWCQENYVTVPFVLCDRDPVATGRPGYPAPYCQMGVKRVAVSCGAAFTRQG